MERFKACERELKTKAYSKEGLQLANKIDPHEKEKVDVCNFITSQVDTLNSQIDKYEAEAEKLQVAIKKSRKGDSNKTERLEEIEKRVERHKHHIMQLEIILRLIENGNLSVDKVNDIRDDIQYYVDNHEEDDFIEDDGIYDELNLTRAEYYGLNNDDDKDNDSDKRDETPLQSPVLSQKDKYEDKKKEATSPLRSLSSKNSLSNISRESRNNSITSNKSPTPTSSFTSSKPGTPRASFTSAVRGSTDVSSPMNSLSVQPRYAAVAAASTDSRTNTPIVVTSQSATIQSKPLQESPTNQQSNENNQATQTQPKVLSKQTSYSEAISNKTETTTPSEAIENKLPPSLSDLEESFEATKARSSKAGSDTMFLQNMLDSSFKYVPRLHDSDEPDFYTMENAYPTPSYYPEEPQKTYENPEIFKKYDVDTLFFIFYYQQGTYQQYLAARELKRQSWRFHKKYHTWFQRLEEPKHITDEYEQGTYIYFDYEGLWCKRKKSEFKFEYCYLEDADLD